MNGWIEYYLILTDFMVNLVKNESIDNKPVKLNKLLKKSKNRIRSQSLFCRKRLDGEKEEKEEGRLN